MIYIFYSYLSEENHKYLLKKYLSEFPVNYQERIKRYKRWQDAQLSLLGRILLYTQVKEIYGDNFINKEIKYTNYDKPYFEDNLIHFNISHSGEIVVCALSNENEIGIDIEIIADIETDCFKSQMTEYEWREIISSSNHKSTFFDYWTQKEAVIKAHGHGLTIPLKSFEILDNMTEINEERYYLKEILINENYKCYISLKTNIGEIYLKEKVLQIQ